MGYFHIFTAVCVSIQGDFHNMQKYSENKGGKTVSTQWSNHMTQCTCFQKNTCMLPKICSEQKPGFQGPGKYYTGIFFA